MEIEPNNFDPAGKKRLAVNILIWTLLMATIAIIWWIFIGHGIGMEVYLFMAFFGAVWLGFIIIMINPKSPVVTPVYKTDNSFKKQSNKIYYVAIAVSLLVSAFYLVRSKHPNSLSEILTQVLIFVFLLAMFFLPLFIAYNFIFHKVPFVPLKMINMVNKDKGSPFLTKPIQYLMISFFIFYMIIAGYLLVKMFISYF